VDAGDSLLKASLYLRRPRSEWFPSRIAARRVRVFPTLVSLGVHDLVSADVGNILLIFRADIFQNVRVREKFLS
jgi:hypothetical protein